MFTTPGHKTCNPLGYASSFKVVNMTTIHCILLSLYSLAQNSLLYTTTLIITFI